MSFLFKPKYKLGDKVLVVRYDRDIRGEVVSEGTIVARRKGWHAGEDMYRYLVKVEDTIIDRFHNELWSNYSKVSSKGDMVKK